MRRNNRLNDCVSFQVNAPKVHVEFVWLRSGDDFGIQVKGPTSDVVKRTSPTTRNGRLLRDDGVDGCERIDVAGESVVFDTAAATGNYTVNILHSGR